MPGTPMTPAASSSKPSGGGGSDPINIYKTLPKAYQKTLAGLLPPTLYASPPSIADTLDIPPSTWSHRVAHKNLLLAGDPPQSISPLVVGKKRNRGYPAARATAAAEAAAQREAREEEEVTGERKRRRILRQTEAGEPPGAGLSYAAITPLHHLHNIYLANLLSLATLPPPTNPPTPVPSPTLPNTDSIQAHLIKADFTGSLLRVRASRNASLRGLSGIVIEETSSTFRLIGQDDKVRTIPKNGTQFVISFPAYGPPAPPSSDANKGNEPSDDGQGAGTYLDPEEVDRWATTSPRIEIDLMGSAFGYRSGERAGRKFRPAQGGGGGSGWGEPWVRGPWSTLLDILSPDSESQAQVGGGGKTKEKRKRGKARRKDPVAWGRKEGVS